MATIRLSASVLSRRLMLRPQCYRRSQPLTSLYAPPATKAGSRARYSTSTHEQAPRAPKIDRAASKLFKDADAAVADLKSGSTILSSGFGLCGVAGKVSPRALPDNNTV